MASRCAETVIPEVYQAVYSMMQGFRPFPATLVAEIAEVAKVYLLFSLLGKGSVLSKKNMQAMKPIAGTQVPRGKICAVLTPTAETASMAVRVKYTCRTVDMSCTLTHTHTVVMKAQGSNLLQVLLHSWRSAAYRTLVVSLV